MNKFMKTLAIAGAAIAMATVSACQSTPTQESAGEYLDATVISTKVRAKIADDPMVSIFDIDVKTFKQVVQLSGFVNTAAEKTRAGNVAASVAGVQSVENNITVKN